jgi:hypothetical protein
MACKDFRTIAVEDEERKRMLCDKPNATEAERIAALSARIKARITSDDHLSVGARVILGAVGADEDGRYDFLRKR